jgi:thioredoxin reductase (NADPH)
MPKRQHQCLKRTARSSPRVGLLPWNAERRGDKPASMAPVLLVAADDPAVRRRLTRDLSRRFGADYRILAVTGTDHALRALDRLDEGVKVAVAFADFRPSERMGSDLLSRVHTRHPSARRVLLTTAVEGVASEALHRATILGQLDLAIAGPWGPPEERLYPQISQLLAAWWRVNRPGYERVRVVGEQWDARSHELRDLGTRNGVPFGFYPADTDAGRRLLRELGRKAARLPIVAMDDGRVLEDPSNAEIAAALGVPTKPPVGVADVTVVGAGPAGLAAAVYAASEGLRTVVVEREALGGQAGTSSMIRNYLGFPHGVSGEELTRRAYEQALNFGAQFVHTRTVTNLRIEGPNRILTLAGAGEIVSRSVILAMGVSYQRLGIPSLERLVGAGVFYGASTSEAQALRGEEVFVVGGGNSAGQAALHLAKYAAKVTILVRGDSLAKSMSTYLMDQLGVTSNIEVRLRTRVINGGGDERLECLVIEDTVTERAERHEAAALFVLIGAVPRTDWLDGTLERDDGGYILTCRDVAPNYQPRLDAWPRPDRPPLPLETSMPGAFAIGDVRHNSVKRVASAVGAGAMAISSAHAYLEIDVA